MRTYVMMFGIANIVAGGPIYNSNKIKYLEQHNWNVVVFPTDSGKIYIKPLEKYNGLDYRFLHFSPYIFGKRKINKMIKRMASSVPQSDCIIIETGTDYTALWGELLAKELDARHIVMFLDEKNKNVNRYSAPFYEFKYKRHELYSISAKSLMHIFSPYFDIAEPEKNVWNAWCTNSVSNINSNIVDELPHADYLIGSIGRLDKKFVPNIIKGVCAFADIYSQKKIGLCFFGGAVDSKIINNIKDEIERHSNIILYISGYIWPIPESVFSHIDAFVSGAGSALISANMGVPTINMDVLTNKPIGIIDDALSLHCDPMKEVDSKVEDYLNKILINKTFPEVLNRISIEDEWKVICADFEKQITQIEKISSERQYFETDNIWDHRTIHRFQKLIAKWTSYKFFLLVQKMYSWIGGHGFKI